MADIAANPLSLGSVVALDGVRYTIDGYYDLQRVIATQEGVGTRHTLDVADILSSLATRGDEDSEAASEVEADGLDTLSKEDISLATEREALIRELVEAETPTKAKAKDVAVRLGVSLATVYRWRNSYLDNGLVALAPHHPTGGRGKPRLNDILDDIIQEVLEGHYLKRTKPKLTKIMRELEDRCRRAGLKPPHLNTVRLRASWISEKDKASAREGKEGRRRFTAFPDKYREATHPNAVWQVDHTPLDVCVVDEVYRQNIGRPWLTLVIDVFSRCVVGYYLSLDKPNAVSVGMALVHSILPKQGWLAAHGIDLSWPVWGLPVTVHADNDKTFRCEPVTLAAKAQRFNLEWRAVGTPHWGAHIERLLGTVNQEIQTINGTTFSNPAKRGDYKPHEEAELTFDEVEEYLVRWICGIYHQQKHGGIGRPPLRKYESGILGDADNPGVGLPAPISDPLRLKIDFLPCTRKTVQNNGVTWDRITYYDPAIDRFINAKDPDNPRLKRKFLLRRDPRDLSFIWFLDPERNVYVKIPYRNLEHPSITLWELRSVRKHLAERGQSEVDEEMIFDTHGQLQRIKAQGSKKTQSARKEAEKKKVYDKKRKTEEAQIDAAGSVDGEESRGEGDQVPPGMSGLLDDGAITPLAIDP